jgi:uncharacterized protein YjbI with pentapeptide repeats
MADKEHLLILKQGVEIWNRWRKEDPQIKPNLINADLSWMDLNQINFHEADLSRAYLVATNLVSADLSNANLPDADLGGADLEGANLLKADLSDANLTGTRLRGANLREAVLYEANLNGTDLENSDLSGAIIGDGVLADLDLREIKGLETVEHYGPSSIGIDTILRSRGKIPRIFLQNAGIPEELFDEISKIITEETFRFYSCFISYSTRDQEFTNQLHSDLQRARVRCWFAPEDIKAGRKLHEQLPQAIRSYDKLLIVLSENSMNSEWVKTEIYHARQDEIRTGKRKLFPIGLIDFEEIRKWQAFDADAGKDMAREIREYFIPDFSDWKNHDSYKKAFDRLLRDLQAEEDP